MGSSLKEIEITESSNFIGRNIFSAHLHPHPLVDRGLGESFTGAGGRGVKIVADKPPNNCCRQKLTSVELKTKRSCDS